MCELLSRADYHTGLISSLIPVRSSLAAMPRYPLFQQPLSGVKRTTFAHSEPFRHDPFRTSCHLVLGAVLAYFARGQHHIYLYLCTVILTG